MFTLPSKLPVASSEPSALRAQTCNGLSGFQLVTASKRAASSDSPESHRSNRVPVAHKLDSLWGADFVQLRTTSSAATHRGGELRAVRGTHAPQKRLVVTAPGCVPSLRAARHSKHLHAQRVMR